MQGSGSQGAKRRSSAERKGSGERRAESEGLRAEV